jgi:hypothetical protein
MISIISSLFFTYYYQGGKIKKEEVGGVYRTHEGEEKYKNCVRKIYLILASIVLNRLNVILHAVSTKRSPT